MTSRDVVNVVQRRLKGMKHDDGSKIKVGHAGTLDPLAEGVLVLAVGRAVRLVPYLQQQKKRYIGKFELGRSSDSGDLEGEITEHPELPVPSREALDAAAAAHVGTIRQTPPAYSAIWIDGVRAHERVRAGEEVDMPSRQVEIEFLRLIDFRPPEFTIDVRCGSGTYIRTLGMDIGRSAGSVALMSHLVRTEIGKFHLDESVSMDFLREGDLSQSLNPPAWATEHLPKLMLDTESSSRLGHGLSVQGEVDGESKQDDHADVAAIQSDGRLRAIVHRRQGAWYPKRVFPVV